MKFSGVFLFALFGLSLILTASATVSVDDRFPGNPFTTIDAPAQCGRFKVVATSRGLWERKCNTVITRSISIGWGSNGATGATSIVKAFLTWQVSRTASTTATEVGATLFDNQPVTVTSRVPMQRGCELAETTLFYDNGAVNVRPLVSSEVVYADVTSIARTWTPGNVQNFTKSVRFTTPCVFGSDKGSRSDGFSLMLVLSDNSFPISSYQVQFGSLSAWYNTPAITDSALLSTLLTYDFTSTFTIPPVADVTGGRRAGALSLVYAVADGGEGPCEVPGGCVPALRNNPSGTGVTVNGAVFLRTMGGGQSKNMNAFRENITLAVTDTTTQVAVKPRCFADCLNFIAMAIEYPCYSVSAQSVEDPHIRSFDGVWTTVFGEGDFAMVESASTGLVVHARFAKNVRGAWAPWTTDLVVRCRADGGTVEVHADRHFANPVSIGADHLPTVTKVGPTQVVVECEGRVSVRAFLHGAHRFKYMNVDYVPLAAHPADLRGLLGSPNANSSDDVQSRGGSSWAAVNSRAHHIGVFSEDLMAIHESWRVPESGRVFYHPHNIDTSLAIAEARSRPAPDPEDVLKASRVCRQAGVAGGVQLAVCVHDVVTLRSTASVRNVARFFNRAS